MSNVYAESKLAFHEEKLNALSQMRVTAPIYVRIKPTNTCNHKCVYCSYVPDNNCPVSELINFKDRIPKQKMLEILDDFKDIGVKAITYSGGGEPLIYPHIAETMKKTLDNGIELSIITNGQELNGEKAEILGESKWVRISASESDAKTFAETRKRPESWFRELIENIENFSRTKNPDCEFGINFVVHEGNFDKIYDSIKHFKELGTDHIKITPCYTDNFLEYHENLKKPSLEQIMKAREDFSDERFTVYDTYENDFRLTGLSQRTYSRCFIMQIIPVIGADSTVYFCHDKTYNPKGILGSIKERSFKELWFSPEAEKIFKNFNPEEACQHHCTYDSRNILTRAMLQDLENLEKYQPNSDKHKNFI